MAGGTAEGDAAADDAADDAVTAGVALAVEAPAAPYPVPAGAGDAATMLAIHSPIPRTAPVSKVMWGDLSFMSRGTPPGPHLVQSQAPLSLKRYVAGRP